MTNVNGALDYLDFYQSIVTSYIASHSEDTKAIQLYQQMENFLNSVEFGNIPKDFDFSSFKKNFASFFHPDALQSRNFSFENSDEMFGIVFSGIDELQKDWTSNKPSSFKQPVYDDYNTQEQDYAYQEQQSHYESQPQTNRNPSISEYISSRFDAIFKGIPSTEHDYDSIKNRYERSLLSLRKRIDALIQTSNYLKADDIRHLRQWEFDVSDASIEQKYMQNLFSLYQNAKTIEHNLNEINVASSERFSLIKPSIDRKYQSWLVSRQQYINEYDSLLSEYISKRKNHLDANFEQLEQEIETRDCYIRSNFLDLQKGYQDIQSRVLLNDEQYVDIETDRAQLCADFSQAQRVYNDYYCNKEIKKDEIKKSVDSEHKKQDQNIKRKIERNRSKITSLGNKYRITEQKLEEFVDTYSPLYDEYSKAK